MLAYLLAVFHGGTLFGGPSSGVARCATGAVPGPTLTHAGRARWLTVPSPSLVPTREPVLQTARQHAASSRSSAPLSEDRPRGPVRFLLACTSSVASSCWACSVLVDPEHDRSRARRCRGDRRRPRSATSLLYPRARVISLVLMLFFFTIVEIPAVLLLALWFALQICFGLPARDPVGGERKASPTSPTPAASFGLLRSA